MIGGRLGVVARPSKDVVSTKWNKGDRPLCKISHDEVLSKCDVDLSSCWLQTKCHDHEKSLDFLFSHVLVISVDMPLNKMVMKYQLVESLIAYVFTLHLQAHDHTKPILTCYGILHEIYYIKSWTKQPLGIDGKCGKYLGILRGIPSVPHNNVMDLNNVMHHEKFG